VSERRRILLPSIAILVGASLSAAALAIWVLYDAAFEEQRARLKEVAQSRARIIEAIARFDSGFSQQDAPGGAEGATLSQIVEAHEKFEGFGETGEFTLARREHDQIVWLLTHRHQSAETPEPIPFSSRLAEPMRRALQGESGTIVGLDYRGATVLAAYEGIPDLGWGVVAKIDIAEVNSPFARAGLWVAGMALAVIAAGVGFILRLTSPLIRRVELRTEELREAKDRLEIRVGERTSELSRANEALKREIGDRERAEEALRQSLDRLNAIQGAVVDGVITIDASGTIESFNPAAVRIFGYRASEVIGRNVKMLMPPPYREQHEEYLAARRQSGQKRGVGVSREITGRRKDGTIFPMSLALGEGVVEGRCLFIGTVRDLTESKRMEEQFLQAQKMEAVGQLAGGVAHDFNNLLASIQGSSELLLEAAATRGDDRAHRDADRIYRAAGRGAALTRQLLTFSRKEIVHPDTVSLNSLVQDLSDLFGHLVGEGLEVKLDLCPSLGNVKLDRGQFDQVLLNLIVNARDAMPRGGCLTLTTANVDLFDERAEGVGVERGQYVVLGVADTGIGIDRKILPHIFEPFFTTKGPSKGTGLGLSTVYWIVKQSGGGIEVQSEVGRGTSFSIYLPRVDEKCPEIRPREVLDVPGTGSETILLVEDDDDFRELAKSLLSTNGYSVIEAACPGDALALPDETKAQIDIVVTDVVMPQMNGVDLVKRLRAERSDLKVLFMSGYTDLALADRGLLELGSAFVRKPFSNAVLTEKVRDVLDAPASA
jgi:PAS domain S-box-containing protein